MPKYVKQLSVFFLLWLGTVGYVLAQACACPPASSCRPCSGGYTSLTLRYNGNTAALVLIVDGTTNLANLTVSPQQQFTIKGSKRNEKFADRSVPVVVNGLTNTLLGSSCGDLQVGLTYGAFTVVAAESIGGSLVCCTTAPPDVQAPQLTNMPAPIRLDATNECSAVATWSEPVATDNCTKTTLSASHPSGSTFAIGVTTVIYTASDEAGNKISGSFTVTVTDTKAPVFSGGPPSDIVLPAGESCLALASWVEPQAADACHVTITRSHEPNTQFNIGTTKVIYEAKDATGNTSTFSFYIIVEDGVAPTFNTFPPDITIAAGSGCFATVSWTAPVVSDRCSAVTLTSSHQPNTMFPVGITNVKFVATDASGNSAEKELVIKVEDKRSIEIVHCPSDLRYTAEENTLPEIYWVAPETAILCETITLQSTHNPGDVFSLGTTAVTYVASTPSGKTASCSFHVIITLEEKPLQASTLITPDGDGLNDEWVVVNIEDYRENQVTVFDRWGGLIYQAVRYDNETVVWKGTNKAGVSVPTGTYFYTIIASDGNHKVHKTGAVELVR